MFDPSEPIRADRVVSMRELAQSAARLVGEVQLDNSVFVLSRHGQMVAVLAPLPECTVVVFEGKASSQLVEVAEEPDADWEELDEDQRAILGIALESHPMPFGVGDIPIPVNRLGAALALLEMSGFTERIGAGRRLTREGVRLARWLDSRHDAPS